MNHVTQTQLRQSQLCIYVPDKLATYSKANTLAFGTSWLCQTGALQQDKQMATYCGMHYLSKLKLMSACTHLYYEYQVHPLESLPRLKPYAAELPARDPSLIMCKKLKLVLNNYCSDFLIFSNLKSLGICKAMNCIYPQFYQKYK